MLETFLDYLYKINYLLLQDYTKNNKSKMWPTQPVQSNTNNMSSEKNLRTLGMTSAISVAEPKPSDIIRTNELKEALKPYNVFESEEELNHRMEILR